MIGTIKKLNPRTICSISHPLLKSACRNCKTNLQTFQLLSYKKYVLGSFRIDLNPRISITPKACISSKRSFAYHQGVALYRHSQARYSVTAFLTSATCCGISSMRSIVYHQAAGRCTLARDEIQPEGLMICTARCAAMICQACGLDKQKRNFW